MLRMFRQRLRMYLQIHLPGCFEFHAGLILRFSSLEKSVSGRSINLKGSSLLAVQHTDYLSSCLRLTTSGFVLSRVHVMPRTTKSKSGGASRSTEKPPATKVAKKQERTVSSIWEKDGDMFITVHAKPGAKQSCVVEVSKSHVSIQSSAPAQEGEANSELVRALACILGVRKSSVSIDHGHRSREKRVRLTDFDKDASEVFKLLQLSVGNAV